MIKAPRSFARPAKEDIHQGEGRNIVRFPDQETQGSAGGGGSERDAQDVLLRLLGSCRDEHLFLKVAPTR